MDRLELAREVSRRTNYTIASCEEIITETFRTMADELEGHGFIDVYSFGRLILQIPEEREYEVRDYKTGNRKRVKVKPKNRIKFIPYPSLKKRIQ